MKYSRFLGKTLQQRVDELSQDTKPAESLRDEIDVMRALAVDALKLYEGSELLDDENKAIDIRLRAGGLITDAMKEIRDMALAMVRIEKESTSARDVALIANMADQFVGCIDDVLVQFGVPNAQQIVDELQAKIKETIVLEDNTGTMLTPDQDVAAMIATVPGAPLLEGVTDAEVAT